MSKKLLIKYLIIVRVKLMRMQELKITHRKAKTNFRNNDINTFNTYYIVMINKYLNQRLENLIFRWDKEQYSL